MALGAVRRLSLCDANAGCRGVERLYWYAHGPFIHPFSAPTASLASVALEKRLQLRLLPVLAVSWRENTQRFCENQISVALDGSTLCQGSD